MGKGMEHYYRKMKTPVGELTLIANEKALVALLWENDKPGRVKILAQKAAPQHPILKETEKQLREYFSGKRDRFEIPYEFYGTAFQKMVWQCLSKIPYGKRKTYSEIAKEIHAPKASRAVGAANGKNPLSIIIPCHRVVGANGSLTGFAGGLKAKEFLLQLECR